MYLKLGTITKSVGLKGEVRVYSTTSLAKQRYKTGNKVFIKFNDEYKGYTIRTYRKLDGTFDVISFSECLDPKSTEDLIKKDVYALKDEKILNKNEFYYVDLIGCDVFDEDNKKIGKVQSVEEFPAQITLSCSRENDKNFFVPFISEFVKDVDVKNKKIVIKVIEGLL